MSHQINFEKSLCWICGDLADSREHRIKKKDLMRHYDRGPYRSDQEKQPVHVHDGIVSEFQGPNAELMKYKPSLCKSCNGTRSQPFDFAYDKFMEWLHGNEKGVLTRRVIDFFEIYGDDFPAQQLNLFKYYIKSFGCRIVDAKLTVPRDLISLLGEEKFQTRIKISFAVNESVLHMPQAIRNGWIGKGELLGWPIVEGGKEMESILWSEYWSWLTVSFWYGRQIEGPMGAPWIANSQFIYLGSHKPLSDEDAIAALKPLTEANSNDAAGSGPSGN